MKIIDVDSIEKATHWTPRDANNVGKGMITNGKKYEIHTSDMDGEPCVIDDNGQDSTIWMAIDGAYTKETKSIYDKLKEVTITFNGGYAVAIILIQFYVIITLLSDIYQML